MTGSSVYACEVAAGSYVAILVPQQGDLKVTITLDDATTYEKTFPQVKLLGGYDYDLSVRTSEQGAEMLLCGQIVDWADGGTLEPEPGTQPDGTIIYAGERYRTQVIAGKCWMAENLRYIPEGARCEQDYWYPEGKAENAALQGILYTYHTATNKNTTNNNNNNYFNSNFNVSGTITGGMNGVVNTANAIRNSVGNCINGTISRAINSSVDDFVNDFAGSADSPVRGICPPGWHIPSAQELEELAACDPGEEFFSCAGYRIVEDAINKFASPGQGIILSASLNDENKMIALKFAKPYYKAAAIAISTKYATSIRCVEN